LPKKEEIKGSCVATATSDEKKFGFIQKEPTSRRMAKEHSDTGETSSFEG